MTALLDTGPWLAYLDAQDPAHAVVAPRLEALTQPLVTTAAVITEVMYFCGKRAVAPREMLEFIKAASVISFDFSQTPELAVCVALMERYADTPMDYADATLVLLAEHLKTTAIVTLDRRGFSTFRRRDGAAFSRLLDD